VIVETRNPSGEAGVSEIVTSFPATDVSEITQNPLLLQVEHLRRRFILSPAMALVTAELAFSSQGRLE